MSALQQQTYSGGAVVVVEVFDALAVRCRSCGFSE